MSARASPPGSRPPPPGQAGALPPSPGPAERSARLARESLPRTVLVITAVVVAVAVCCYLLFLLRKPLAWLVLAAFLAVALSGPVGWLSRRMRRGLAITLTYVGLLLIPPAIAGIVLPPLATEAAELVEELPNYVADLDEWVQSSATLRGLDEQFAITRTLEEQAATLPNRLGDAAGWLSGLGVGLVNSIFAAVTIVILSVFMVANGRHWLEAFLALGPEARTERIRPSLDRMSETVGAYVAGALLQALMAGVATFIVLTVLGVPFAAPLAVLVALFDLIPMVGATIAAVFVGVITVFSDFPTDTIVWTVWAIVYQQVENTVIQPRIQKRAVGVHPFTVIVAVLIGGTLFGIPGALLAVPVAAMAQIALRDWWAWRCEMRRTAIALPGPAPPADEG